jgi:hypothetical protein
MLLILFNNQRCKKNLALFFERVPAPVSANLRALFFGSPKVIKKVQLNCVPGVFSRMYADKPLHLLSLGFCPHPQPEGGDKSYAESLDYRQAVNGFFDFRRHFDIIRPWALMAVSQSLSCCVDDDASCANHNVSRRIHVVERLPEQQGMVGKFQPRVVQNINSARRIFIASQQIDVQP